MKSEPGCSILATITLSTNSRGYIAEGRAETIVINIDRFALH